VGPGRQPQRRGERSGGGGWAGLGRKGQAGRRSRRARAGLQGGHGLLPSELGRWLASADQAAAQAAAAAGLLDGLGRIG
jgi:ribosomal protein L15